MKFYLVGIKGAGMCSLSNILYDLGHEIRGCDYSKKFYTDNMINDNVTVDKIDSIYYDNDFTYIIGNAYKISDISKNIKENYNYYDYPEFIENFFRIPKISISGTHGKTTTTSFLSQITNIDVNVLCGDAKGIGNKNAKYMILEACEYQNHFLSYTNKILLINNIEHDHPDFFDSIKEVLDSFQIAANNSNILVINGDCKNCLKIKHLNMITFGQNDYNDIIFKYDISEKETKVSIAFYGNNIKIKLPLVSNHNVYNYVGAYIISKLIDTKDDYIKEKSLNIKLPKRRMQTTFYGNSIIIDDYAHHPTEIKSTLTSIKQIYNEYDVVVLFQPHTYSRTISFKDEFIKSLKIADETYILDVFSSVREQGNGNILLEEKTFKYFDKKILSEIGVNKKVYVFMGAGDINNIIKEIE